LAPFHERKNYERLINFCGWLAFNFAPRRCMVDQMKISTPAFPTWVGNQDMAPGMTLRVYIATAALQGFCANHDMDKITIGQAADWAFRMADEMIKVSNK